MAKKVTDKVTDCERWSLQQITDPSFLDALIPQCETLFGKVIIEFSDGAICCSKRMGFLNLFWFPIVTSFGIPLRKDHFIKSAPITKEFLVNQWNRYYEEIMNMDFRNAKKLKKAIWDVHQKMYAFTCSNLLPYVASMDIMDLAEILEEPPMKELIDSKWTLKPEMGTDVIEKIIDEKNKQIMDLLGKPGGLKNTALYTYQRVKQLNKFQVPQTLLAFGVRTDVNDSIIGLPVIGNATEGLQDINEFAVETLSAKKALFYNHLAVADSQYFGRKVQLTSSSIEHLYTTDCGSNILVPFRVTKNNYLNLIGKVIIKDGQKIILDPSTIGSYVGEEIHMRSPMTCRFVKGVCEGCGGKIFQNINRKLNIGILSAMHVIEPTTQKILSAKHLIKTVSLIYEVPDKTSDILFRSSTNEIRWRPTFADKLKHLHIGIFSQDFPGLHDVTLLRSDKPVKEERLSAVHQFALRDSKGKVQIYALENEKRVPFFSSDFLFHVRDHYNSIEIDEQMIWIPLEGTEKFPIFKTVVINDNMLQFVNRVSNFLSGPIKDFTSCSEELQEFSNLVHDKVEANLVHLEVLSKAFMIRSDTDLRIPRVTDQNNVKFQTISAILNYRHIGTKLAYQALRPYMAEPSTYLIPKQSSPFDLMSIGYES